MYVHRFIWKYVKIVWTQQETPNSVGGKRILYYNFDDDGDGDDDDHHDDGDVHDDSDDDVDVDVEEEDRLQDREAHFVRVCAVEVHMDISQDHLD